jgi:hypothetical protein
MNLGWGCPLGCSKTYPSKPNRMDNWTFGWTLALIGAIGTMLILWIMSLLILLIRKIFPYVPEDSAAKKG